jgi:hypothetical protein
MSPVPRLASRDASVSTDVWVADATAPDRPPRLTRSQARGRPHRVVRRPARPDAGPHLGPAPAPQLAPSPARSVDDDRRQLRAALDRARTRGLLPGDDAAVDRLVAEARAASGRGQDARLVLRQLDGRVDTFRIDRVFANRKLTRLEAAIARARLDGPQRTRISADAQRILKLVLADRLVEASQLISAVGQRLR